MLEAIASSGHEHGQKQTLEQMKVCVDSGEEFPPIAQLQESRMHDEETPDYEQHIEHTGTDWVEDSVEFEAGSEKESWMQVVTIDTCRLTKAKGVTGIGTAGKPAANSRDFVIPTQGLMTKVGGSTRGSNNTRGIQQQ